MFSHAFEEIGKTLDLPMAHHEYVSGAIIGDSEVREAFSDLGLGFAEEVADLIKRGRPGNLYDAVVSSQFDADRLDYMRRDRLMTGVQNSGIDFDWLMANLEVGNVATGVDELQLKPIETLVLGPKAVHAAETYVLALFQLYPTIYFHKTTRAAEKVFSTLMLRLIRLVRDGSVKKTDLPKATGLPKEHPIIRFAKNPDQLEHALDLDDAVFWGALPMIVGANDPVIANCAKRLRDRRLPKCWDIRETVVAAIAPNRPKSLDEAEDVKRRLARHTESIAERLVQWSIENSTTSPRILVDKATRSPYKPFRETSGHLNQILIRSGSDRIRDMAEFSQVVAGLETFELFRAYFDETDVDAKHFIGSVIKEELRRP